MKKKVAKCEQCCPTGGAILIASYNDSGEMCWRCDNCHLETVRRQHPRKGEYEPTPNQQKVIDMLTRTFGGEIKVEMVGRKVFITGSNESRPFFTGQGFYGTIGVRGTYVIKLQRFGGDVEITDMIGISVYLEPTRKS
jgi:hypothetical protein